MIKTPRGERRPNNKTLYLFYYATSLELTRVMQVLSILVCNSQATEIIITRCLQEGVLVVAKNFCPSA